MFRKLYNQAILTGTLRPDGPLLIVQGGAALDPMAPDLAFVRTVRNGAATVYLPGSSIKGVLRAQAERILATLIGEGAAEDPFEFSSPLRKKAREHKTQATSTSTSAVYRISCEADRLFGSTEVAGRFRVGDAYPSTTTLQQANTTEIRYGVGIDRAKQAARTNALFEQEAVTAGVFELRALLENYELWMLSLILQVLRDLNEGLIQVGHSKSRGFGSVTVEEPSLDLRWPGARPSRLEGAGAREAQAAVRGAYGLDDKDWVELPSGAEEVAEGLLQGYRFKGWQGIGALLQATSAEPWARLLERNRSGDSHGA